MSNTMSPEYIAGRESVLKELEAQEPVAWDNPRHYPQQMVRLSRDYPKEPRKLYAHPIPPPDVNQSEAIRELVEALRKAKQLASIASDWNLDEVEIDGNMVWTRELEREFDAALAKWEKKP